MRNLEPKRRSGSVRKERSGDDKWLMYHLIVAHMPSSDYKLNNMTAVTKRAVSLQCVPKGFDLELKFSLLLMCKLLC